MRIGMILVTALSLAACHHNNDATTTTASTDGKSLYDRLGGQDAIKAVVKDFVEENVAKDDRINSFFKNADIPHLEQSLVDQICNASGGPCKYTGKDMKTAHTGMGIKDADFSALVEDLTKSLKKFNVADKDQQELVNALGGMKGDVVAPAAQ